MQSQYKQKPKTLLPPGYEEAQEDEQERKKRESGKEDSCCKDCCDCCICLDDTCCRPVYYGGPYGYTTNGCVLLNCAVDCAESKSSCTSCGCESCNCNDMDCKDPKACLIITGAICVGGVVLSAASAAIYSVKEVVVAFNESCRSGTIKTVIGGAGAAVGWFASEALANYIAAQAGPTHHPEIIKPVVKGVCASIGSAATLFLSKVKCSRMGMFSSSLREPLNPENPDLQNGPMNQP